MTPMIATSGPLTMRTCAAQKSPVKFKGRSYTILVKNDPTPIKRIEISREEFYEGETVNGKPHGKGFVVSPRGKDEGEWVHGKRTGYGTTTYVDGSQLKGYWKDNTYIRD